MIKQFFDIGETVILQSKNVEIGGAHIILSVILPGQLFSFEGQQFRHPSTQHPAYDLGLFHESGLPFLFLQPDLKRLCTPANMSFKELLRTIKQNEWRDK